MSTTPYGHHQRSDEERDLEQARYRRALVTLRLLQGAFAIAVLALLGAAVFVIVQVRGTQLEGTPLGKRLLEQADTIQSCTSTNGKCTKTNQRKTAGLIADLMASGDRSAAAAAACAAKPGVTAIKDTNARAASILACMVGLDVHAPRSPGDR